MKFTDEQLAVIHHGKGHAKVSAVAGSGKSATMIERIAFLISSGIEPSKILSVMFNTSAKESFEAKLRRRIGNEKCSPVKTFHGLGLEVTKILEQKGFLKKKNLESKDWVEAVIAKDALRQASKNGSLDKEEIELFVDFIGLVKSDIVSADDKVGDIEEIVGKEIPAYFVDAFDIFEQIREDRRIRFFSDLIYEPVKVLIKNKDAKSLIADRFSHIIIDEYQDINECQQVLMTIIAGKTADVTVVGDEDQCIYEFRGAAPSYMRNLFDVDFPNPTEYKLSYTFRYGHQISLLANHVITQNEDRHDKLCLSHHTTPHTQIYRHEGENEGEKIISIINKHVEDGGTFNDIAIMVRMYGNATGSEIAMLKFGIPYKNTSGQFVLERKEALAPVAYGELSIRKEGFLFSGEKLVESLFNSPTVGLSNEMTSDLVKFISNERSLDQGISKFASRKSVADWVMDKVKKRASLIEMVMTRIDGKSKATDLFSMINTSMDVERSYVKLSANKESGLDKLEVFKAVQAMGRDKSISDFIFEINNAIRQSKIKQKKNDLGFVTVTSIHKSKGLEYPIVMMPCLRDDTMPATSAGKNPIKIEAERRLFYVGVTRAQKELHLFHPEDTELEYRSIQGWNEVPDITPYASRFMFESNFEISKKIGNALYVEEVGYAESVDIKAVSTVVAEKYMDSFDDAMINIKKVDAEKSKGRAVCGKNTPCIAEVGMYIFSEKHGRGKIESIIPRADTFIIKCMFEKEKTPRVIAANIETLLMLEE